MICPAFPAPEYIIFSTLVPSLLYYSYLPALLISFPFGIYIFQKNPALLLNKLIFAITTFFAAWAFFVLILWTNINSSTIVFFWSFLGIISSLIAVSTIYFVSVFLRKGNDVKLVEKIVYLLVLIPPILITPTAINLSGFDLNICGSAGFVGFAFVSYYRLLGLFSVLWIISLLVYYYKKSDPIFRKQIIFMGVGVVFFLSLFSGIGYYVDYITAAGITDSYSIELYGMFGMVIFIIFIGILIVKYGAFNIKLITTQALVWALVALIGSEFFFTHNNYLNIVLISITLVVSAWVGLAIVRGVKREIEQKEELAKLNINLRNLMKERESLFHLINHKVKGSFTRTKLLFDGMLTGTFGEISPEIRKRAQQGFDFDNGGLQTVDLILNVANLQNGIIKYDMKQVDFKKLVEQVISEKKIATEAKGLKLETEIKDGNYSILGDSIWLKEAINNLVENSLRYTREGKIVVGLERRPTSQGEGEKILFSVKDTGVGITDEDKKNLFTEGGRGRKLCKSKCR